MMERRDIKNIVNGVSCGILFSCGLMCSFLFSVAFSSLAHPLKFPDLLNVTIPWPFGHVAKLPWWTIGFPYMISGVIGVFAAFVKIQESYASQMVSGIVTLIMMGILAPITVKVLSDLPVYDKIYICSIINSTADNDTLLKFCARMVTATRMIRAAVVVMVFGWIFCLATTITAGMLGGTPCSSQTHILTGIVEVNVQTRVKRGYGTLTSLVVKE